MASPDIGSRCSAGGQKTSPAPRPLTPAEHIAWLRLIRTESIGPVTFFQLLERFGDAESALEAVPDLARRGGRKRLRVTGRDEAEAELAEAAAAGAAVVGFGEPAYPPLLHAIPDPPPLLFLKGHEVLLQRDCVAVVGARNASAGGIRFARALAADLGEAGFAVVSGLARGIDAAAHAGALAGGTIAVVAGGIDKIYPIENTELYEQIAAQGAIIAETRMGTTATARHFPRRNRLIAGLSLGVAVVEAAPRSGSLITARLAAEQGREVFAVPGSPLDPRARGTNDLIRQGATLVESAADIARTLAAMRERRIDETDGRLPISPPSRQPSKAELEPARRILIPLLSRTPIEVNELIRQSKLTPPAVITILLELDLADRLDRHPGNKVSIR